MAPNQALPLSRYTVLDLTRARAGPTCVRQLVDWGAQAIKIEMPGGRSGDGMGGNRHGFDFQNLHRNKKAMTLNLRDPEGVAIFKELVKKADIVVENYRPDVKRRLGIDYEDLKRDQPAADLRQHLRLRPERPVSRSARRRPDRPGHGRADVDHRHSGAGAGARGHSDRRPVLGHPARAGHPGGAHRARDHRPGQVGAHLAARGDALDARFPGLALADEQGSAAAGRQQPSDRHSHRRLRDQGRPHQHRRRRRRDLRALLQGHRPPGAQDRRPLCDLEGALHQPRRADRRADADHATEDQRRLDHDPQRRRRAVRADLPDRRVVRRSAGAASRRWRSP